MKTMNGKNKSNLIIFDYSQWLKLDVSCDEICSFKNTYNKTEQIIVKLLHKYFGEVNDNGITILWCPRYLGLNGCNQEIDISVEKNDEVIFGISIKSRFGGGDLRPNDLTLLLLNEYKQEIKRFEVSGHVNDVLQDMARIMNIKDAKSQFRTMTILFAKPHQKKWVERMKRKFSDHEYLFLSGNKNSFFEELERINPDIIKYKV